ncbi:gluconate 2-dehydrogenase subunit 3 family protein [Parahaliea mediterranea]|uniref:gluconate 2-dehydrogenase subunit 3 family protein n=1 Tax=Parahaliea mediterranea TaxID=651086 RepID=UPI001300A953|nr:gluconate 2-dehydrogenase subunit 3 family protein [Parahaliea mediterranea]
MNRRQLLAASAWALAITGSWPVASGLRSSASTSFTSSSSETLSAHKRELVRCICEAIIPETDTPGATTARVPDFIKLIYDDWFTAEERREFLSGLYIVDGYARRRHSQSFIRQPLSIQQDIFRSLQREAEEAQDRNIDLREFVATIRELVVTGYFMSEAASKNTLAYNPAPMSYEGDYALDNVNKQWTY